MFSFILSFIIYQVIRLKLNRRFQKRIDGGKFFFPVLSLSNIDRIVASAKSIFENIERLSHKVWTLPDEMKPHMEKLKELNNKGFIKYEEKFGLILWYTDIYIAYNSINNKD